MDELGLQESFYNTHTFHIGAATSAKTLSFLVIYIVSLSKRVCLGLLDLKWYKRWRVFVVYYQITK